MALSYLSSLFTKRGKTSIRSFSEKSGDRFSGIPNQHIVSPSDRFWLKFTRTLPEKDIGKEVSVSVMQKAVERRRIAVNISVMVTGAVVFYFVLKSTRQKRNARLDELLKE